MKKTKVFFVILCMCLTFVGCSSTKKSDAKDCVKSYLDAYYKEKHDSYKMYAEFIGEDPEELQDKWTSQLYEVVTHELMDEYPTEEFDGSVTNLLDNIIEARKLAKYKVTEVSKAEDGYLVKVKIEPSNVFSSFEDNLDFEDAKKNAENYSDNILDAIAEKLRIAIDEHVYEEPQEMEVHVIEDGDDIYIESSQMEKIDLALFPRADGN